MSGFDWQTCLANRKRRMLQFLELDAPDAILDHEAKLLRKAVHQTHSGFRLALADIASELRRVFDDAVFGVQVFYLKRVRGFSDAEIETRFFGENEATS